MSGQGVTRRSVLRSTALGVFGAAALPTAEAVMAPAARAAAAPLSLTVDTAHPGHAVSPDLYGVFFEEINYAGVGGIYAELIRNRAFMDPATPAQWIAPADIPRVPGKSGSALQLGGSSPAQYVQMPQGILGGLTDFTIAAWVNPAALATWSRLFDFGTGEIVNMFLTVSAGGQNTPRFAITNSGNGNEQRLNAPSPLPLNQWTHLAVTLSGTTGTLYVNGTAVATNNGMTLNPSSLGTTTQNYIGKSQYPADPYLNAAVDEFQIYSRALTAAEVQSLTTSAGGTAGGGNVAWYRFDEAKGAVAVDSSGNNRNGTIVPVTSDWTPVLDGGGSMTASLDSGTPLNDQLTRSLRMDVTSAGPGQRVGMANDGYFGVPVVPGQTYQVSFFAKSSNQFSGPVTVSLETSDGSRSFATAQVGGLTRSWQRVRDRPGDLHLGSAAGGRRPPRTLPGPLHRDRQRGRVRPDRQLQRVPVPDVLRRDQESVSADQGHRHDSRHQPSDGHHRRALLQRRGVLRGAVHPVRQLRPQRADGVRGRVLGDGRRGSAADRAAWQLYRRGRVS